MFLEAKTSAILTEQGSLAQREYGYKNRDCLTSEQIHESWTLDGFSKRQEQLLLKTTNNGKKTTNNPLFLCIGIRFFQLSHGFQLFWVFF